MRGPRFGEPWPAPDWMGATPDQALARAQIRLSKRKSDVKRRPDHLIVLGFYTGVKLFAGQEGRAVVFRFEPIGRKSWTFLHMGIFHGIVDFFDARHLRRTIWQSLREAGP